MTFRSFFKEIFQDVDDGFSAKRTAFFIFVALIVACVIATVIGHTAIPALIWNGLVDLVKWIGAAILGERVPASLAAFRKPGP
jgi:hypothetical protein